jgi:hypothetical protein
MKNNRLGPQSPGLRAFAAAIVISLAGCGEVPGGTGYFEFDAPSGTVTGYDDDGPKDVTLPSDIDGIRVTAVGKNAFRGKQLTGVSIFTGITVIGEGAFADNKLTSVILEGVISIIKEGAFEDNRLETLVIPGSVIAIGERAFADNRLTDVTIGGEVVSIGNGAFAVNQLSGIVIPGSVTAIGEGAFSGNPLIMVTLGPNKDYASKIVPDFGKVYDGLGKQAGVYVCLDNVWTKQQ